MENFLETYHQLLQSHLDGIRNLLANDAFRQIGWEYRQQKDSHSEKPFNAFTLASDLYYRENFHSDIIKAFLDPNENHKEGTTFLFAFIDFLNNNFENRISIVKADYLNSIVERELGKIDIRIRSEESKHCIIIENKMNNAGDMPRQLPRYYDEMTGLGYKVDAIVYLPLDENKHPDTTSWTEDDKCHVLPLLCQIPAFQRKGIDLVNGWLLPCSQLTKNLDCVSLLRQYSELITYLSNNNMDNVILGKFYNALLEGDNLQSALSIRNMLNDLPVYMKGRIMDRLKNDGFNNLWSWPPRPNHCGVIFKKDGAEYKIDIWSSEEGYSVCVFGQNMPLIDVPWSNEINDSFKELGYTVINENYQKKYPVTEEATVIKDVELLAGLMDNMLK